MHNEAQLWRYVRDRVGMGWSADKIDDNRAPSVADVFYRTSESFGWIELKVGHRPDNRSLLGPLTLPTLTDGQREWLSSTGARGCPTWILTFVPEAIGGAPRLFLLHSWRTARVLGTLSVVDSLATAVASWSHHIDAVEFVSLLNATH